jgi:hypothetical protein
MSSYRFTFIILDYENVNLHINFTNHIYNVIQYTRVLSWVATSNIKLYIS